MAALTGLILALAVMIFARIVGLDRDRAFYPVVLIIVASYYVLFAAIGKFETDTMMVFLQFAFFAAIAVAGFRTSLWLVVAGLAAHGVFDLFYHSVAIGRDVPSWWPPFCSAFDLVAAAGLAVLLVIGSFPVRPKREGE